MFRELISCREDFQICKFAFNTALREAKSIRDATAERMAAEQQHREQRRAELGELIADPERSPTVRRLAEGDLARLDEIPIKPTAAEIAAHEEQIEAAKAALHDLRMLQERTKELIRKASADLQQLRSEILGDQAIPLAPRWIESKIAAFEQLGGAANVG